MSIVGFRQISFNTTDLSQASVLSEVVDVRDLRNFVVVITLTGTPTGTLAVTNYYGTHTLNANGTKNWSSATQVQDTSFSPGGTANTYVYVVNAGNGKPISAYSLTYTRTMGAGTIAAVQQAKSNEGT